MKSAIALCAWAASLSLAAPISSVPSRADVPPLAQPEQMRLATGGLGRFETSWIMPVTKQWSPSAESSLVEEEAAAMTHDVGVESTIVEWETKAARDSWVWVPCPSRERTMHYRRVRIYADKLVVGLVLAFIAVLMIVELWVPVARRIRRARAGPSPTHIEDKGTAQVIGEINRGYRDMTSDVVADSEKEVDSDVGW